MKIYNQFKTVMLLAALAGLVIMIGGLLGGRTGLMIGLVIALVLNFTSYWFSDKIAIKMTRSRPVTEAEAPELYASVRKLCAQAQMPMPKLHIQPSDQPNAFATGRNPDHAAISVTEGLMRLLDRDELEGVLAHELAHIKNRDILISSVAAVIAAAITYITYIAMFFGGGDRDRGPAGIVIMLFAWIIAPIAAMLIQMAISRSREFMADQTGAEIAGRPDGLANALLALESGSRRIPMEVNQGAAHMFIVNPLSGQSLQKLFSTHPPIEERVRRLRSINDPSRALA